MDFERAGIYLLTGIGVGILAGLFGVGGGMIAVPVLTYGLGFDHRRAAGTSLLAIIFPVTAAAASYLWAGHYSLPLAALLAAGSILGVQVGTRLLRSVNVQVVRIFFAVMMASLAASLVVVIPARELSFTITPGSVVIVIGIGFGAGFIAGMLGIGGGGVVIPLLIFSFGISDLVVKGSALLMMIVTTASGTVANIRYRQVDYQAAIPIGLCAVIFAPAGAWIAQLLSPFVANLLFALFLAVVIAKTLAEVVRTARRQPRDAA